MPGGTFEWNFVKLVTLSNAEVDDESFICMRKVNILEIKITKSVLEHSENRFGSITVGTSLTLSILIPVVGGPCTLLLPTLTTALGAVKTDGATLSLSYIVFTPNGFYNSTLLCTDLLQDHKRYILK